MIEFQRSASEQGARFERVCVEMLRIAGWTITAQHSTVAGAEVDIEATDPDGVEWWIECKGSFNGKTPGSKRGDTVKKAVGVAWYLSRLPGAKPYMLLTSHLPARGTLPHRLLRAAERDGLFGRISEVGFVSLSEDEDDDA